jgi:hypothetical protein
MAPTWQLLVGGTIAAALVATGWVMMITGRREQSVRWSHLWPFHKQIPLHVAARRVYEAAEEAGVVDLMLSPTSTPESKLMHFKMLLVVDNRVRLFGAKPPSTQSRLISRDELQGHDVYPADGDVSRLDNLHPSSRPPAYAEVTVPRTDLRRIIKIYLDEYVSEAKKLRRGIWS